MNIEQIKEYIKEKGINKKNGKWAVSHPRFYLCSYLRHKTDLTLEQIAEIVGYKQHDNVIHAIKKHNQFLEYKDKVYRENIKGVKNFLNTGEFEYKVYDIRTEVLKCKSLIELHRIQKLIQNEVI